MFDQIVSFVQQAVQTAFPNVPCYREYRGQDFTRPAFSVEITGAAMDREMGDRYLLTCHLRLRYYDNLRNGDGQVDLYERLGAAALTLYGVLDYDRAIHTAMSHKTDDKLLEFSLTYRFHLQKCSDAPAPAVPMSRLSLRTAQSETENE